MYIKKLPLIWLKTRPDEHKKLTLPLFRGIIQTDISEKLINLANIYIYTNFQIS